MQVVNSGMGKSAAGGCEDSFWVRTLESEPEPPREFPGGTHSVL